MEKNQTNPTEVSCHEDTNQSTKSSNKNSNPNTNNCITLTDHIANDHENFFQFDYLKHSHAIFEEYNTFRTHPKRKLGNMLKNNILQYDLAEYYLETINKKLEVSINKNDIEIDRNVDNFGLSKVLWSEKIYNSIYSSNKADRDSIYQRISSEFNHSPLYLFKLEGTYDPESALCKLLEFYKISSSDVLMSKKVYCGAVCVYNENSIDNIIFALIKYQI